MTQTIIQTNFTAGELAPALAARVDIEKYNNGAKTLRNVIVEVTGGVRRRGGFRFITKAKHDNKNARLIPYIFSRDQAYMLEFGDGYMRVFKDGGQVTSGGIPYEIPTPYSDGMLPSLTFVQGADTMFLAHQSVPIHRLRRLDHADWVLEPAPFVVTPVDEIGHRPDATLNIPDTSVGTLRYFNTTDDAFLVSDVGRQIIGGGGAAKITSFVNSTQVVGEITTRFRSGSIAAGDWLLAGSPQAAIGTTKKEPVGEKTVLQSKSTTTATNTFQITALYRASIPFQTVGEAVVPGHTFVQNDVVVISGCSPSAWNGSHTLTYVNGDVVRFPLASWPGNASVLGTMSKSTSVAAPAAWRIDDAGKFVAINGGLVQITQVTSPTTAEAVIVKALSATIDALPNAWTLKAPVWNPIDGYPAALSLYEQRLIAAGSPGFPDYIWLSRIGRPLDFTMGTLDDDGFAVPIYSDQINPVAHLSQTKALIALTYGGESTIVGGIERPLTYSTAQIKNQSTYGCSQVRPIRIGNQIFFLQRGSTTLRAAGYNSDTDGFVAPEVSKLSRHLTGIPIVSMAHQQSPDSRLWLVRQDGVMLVVTIDQAENVIAWTQHNTDGGFEDVATIPQSTGPDQVWAVVRRDVNGSIKRFIELQDAGINTDSSVTGSSGSPTAVWGGFGHLIGRQVRVVGNGAVLPDAVVSPSGDITLSSQVSSIEAGLYYESEVELLTPEVIGPNGSAQGNNMRTVEVTLVLRDTIGCRVNDVQRDWRQYDIQHLDTPLPPFIGQLRFPLSGWERGASPLRIVQDQPLPFRLLGVIRKLTSNG